MGRGRSKAGRTEWGGRGERGQVQVHATATTWCAPVHALTVPSHHTFRTAHV